MATGRASAAPVDQVLARAFAPVHKRALGLAVGVTSGGFVFLLTAFHLLTKPDPSLPIGLLGQYFYGYKVTWTGAFAGLWWGFVAGFAAGWFVGFLRNFGAATWILLIRTKTVFSQANDFFDQI
jgi:hypothetical protein